MLLDSNIIIYAIRPEYDRLRQFIAENAPSVSLVSYVEVLGYHRLTETERQAFEEFFNAADVLPITDEVAEQAIRLRQQRRISLGDSFVAGTALAFGLTLVTHNTEDFRWIDGLNLLDPLLPEEG
jgi:predicted nucleic acid-binding protein